MPRRRSLRIYYGHIYLHRPSLNRGEANPILDALRPGVPARHYGRDWVIGNLNIDQAPGFVTGRLGHFPELEEEVETDYDLETGSFIDLPVPRRRSISASFAMHHPSGALAFEESEIGPTGFLSHLAKVMTNTGAGQFRGYLIREEETYRAFIRRADKITRVAYEIRRPNPHDREIFRPLADDLRAANAERQRRVYENDDGLSVPLVEGRDSSTDNPLVAGIEMVEEGYGDGYRIDGVSGGQKVHYDSTSKTSDYRDEVEDVPDDYEERSAQVLAWLRERLAWLLSRT